LGREGSQGHKPDKPDGAFSSAWEQEHGLFSHARGKRFVWLVRLQQLLMGRPDEKCKSDANHSSGKTSGFSYPQELFDRMKLLVAAGEVALTEPRGRLRKTIMSVARNIAIGVQGGTT
jgi:hypothetical protein